MITKFTNPTKGEMILAVEYKQPKRSKKNLNKFETGLTGNQTLTGFANFIELKSWWKFRNRMQFLISKDMLTLSYKVIVRWNIHKLQQQNY